MGLHDVDKNSPNRGAPTPNAPDLKGFLPPSYPLLAEFDAVGGAVQTDETSRTIQGAIDAMSDRGGGTVYVPSGTYVLTEDLTIPSNVGLSGQAFGSVMFVFAGPYGIRVTGSSPYSTGTISVTRGSAIVTGSGTSWLSNITTSHKIKIDGIPYQVAAVLSDTQLVLTTAQFGQTQSGLSYLAAIFAEQVEVSNIIVISSTSTGLVFTYTDLVVVSNVIVPGAGIYGIQAIDSARHSYDNVVLDGCRSANYVATRLDFSNMTRMIMTNSSSNGCEITDCNEVIFQSSPANSNGGVGYYVSGGSRMAWLISEANENTSHGIHALGSLSSVIISGGAFNRNVDGIRLAGTVSKCTITNGVIATGNTGYGVNISVAGVDRTIVSLNQLTSNSSGAVNNAGSNTINVNNQT